VASASSCGNLFAVQPPGAYNVRTRTAVADSEIIFAVEESPEGGDLARALEHDIFTEADSIDELKTMIRDAVSCHFEETERPCFIGIVSS
jgi:hypothetical protein